MLTLQNLRWCGKQLLSAILQILQHNLRSGWTRAFGPRNSARYFGLDELQLRFQNSIINNTTEVPVKCRGDAIILAPNSKLSKILWLKRHSCEILKRYAWVIMKVPFFSRLYIRKYFDNSINHICILFLSVSLLIWCWYSLDIYTSQSRRRSRLIS